MNPLYIGLMSGTSLDGVDGVLAELHPQSHAPSQTPTEAQAQGQAHGRTTFAPLKVLAHVSQPFDADLRDTLLQLNRPGDNEIHRSALAANRLAEAYADVVHRLLAQTGQPATAIRAIGAHGQTVRHRPQAFDGRGYTVQVNQPALLAELTGIAVVADFRSRDVAAGGQGAPLVPAFHRALWQQPGQDVAVLNLGGIANLSLLPAQGPVLGFDCGPANVLMDLWIGRHLGHTYDADGRWAAAGQVHDGLLAELLSEAWLQLAPPKSTGRDLFDADWLDARLARWSGLAPVDVQATLCEFTAACVGLHLDRHAVSTRELVVCGGGALNGYLMARLAARQPAVRVRDSSAWGLPPLQVEAAAFAWLASACLAGQPGNLQEVTGASGPRVLGAVYPA